jgi:Reverse transcriptase (RNA-dependent DNA polymerase)
MGVSNQSITDKRIMAKGFSQNWLRWIQQAVLPGTSQIMLNSVAGRKIKLKRRVRQGDPLSPYLFILAVDFLPMWLEALSQQNLIQKPFPQCKQCLLYADDTFFILQPQEQQLRVLKFTLDFYAKISRLKISLEKLELLVTTAETKVVQNLAQIMGCKASNFPFKYFGMSLSNKKLQKEHYLPLIQKI